MNFRQWPLRGSVTLLFLVSWWIWLWQPARQVRLHQQNLFRAYERRDWQKVSRFLDEKYADRWMHDKPSIIAASRQVFSQFLVLGVSAQTLDCSASGSVGRISSRITLHGQGSPVAELVMERVNGLHQPFIFDWVQDGWQPWSWALVRMDQTELSLELPEF